MSELRPDRDTRTQPLQHIGPQTRTVGGTFDLSFTLPEPSNAGGGPKKDRKTSNATKKKLTKAKTKKATKLPQHTPRPQRVPTRDPSQEAG